MILKTFKNNTFTNCFGNFRDDFLSWLLHFQKNEILQIMFSYEKEMQYILVIFDYTEIYIFNLFWGNSEWHI